MHDSSHHRHHHRHARDDDGLLPPVAEALLRILQASPHCTVQEVGNSSCYEGGEQLSPRVLGPRQAKLKPFCL